MAIDTFMVYVGVYPDVGFGQGRLRAVKDLQPKAGLIDAYDAAVVEQRETARSRS